MSLYSLHNSITWLNDFFFVAFTPFCLCITKSSAQVLIEKYLKKQNFKVTSQVFLEGTTLM